MASMNIRLSALTLFLILLGVILIGFLMHYTWESFASMKKEGFTSDFTKSTLLSTELNGKYSTNNVKTAKLMENLFYDPVEKVLIDVTGTTLYMKRKDGTDLSYNTNTTAKIVTDISGGSVQFVTQADSSYNVMLPDTTSTSWASKTVSDAKTRFKDITDNKYIYMDISGITSLTDATPLSDTTTVRFFYSTHTSPPVVAINTLLYPPLLDTDEAYIRRCNRTLVGGGMAVSSAHTEAPPLAFGWCTPNGIGVVSIPLYVGGQPSNTTFIHVMDITNNKHMGAFYFKGNEVEVYNFSDQPIVTGDFRIPEDTNQGTTTDTEVVFAKDISGIVLPFHVTGSNIYVGTYHDAAKKLIYLACKVGNDAHQTYIKIGTDNIITFPIRTETSYGSSSASTSSGSSDYDDEYKSSDYSSGDDTFTELTKAMDLVKRMQALFGSQDSDYFLKTEVVPPVCPTCPSCSSSDGVCSNCGGNGGCGTKKYSGGSNGGGGVTNIIRDGVGGVTNVGRDAIGGVTNVGRDAIAGTVELGKDAVVGGLGLGLMGAAAVSNVASGAGNFVKDSGSGIGQFAKDSASGMFNATKEIGSGAYGVTKDAVGGTVGLGREIVGGVGDFVGRGGGYQNSYGGPQFNNNQGGGGYYNNQGGGNQGGYLQPRQQANTQGQDPYSYYGSVPPREGRQNYIPRTADFSSFGR